MKLLRSVADIMTKDDLSGLHLLRTKGENPRARTIDTLPILEVRKLIYNKNATVTRTV
jgi:hypothetical protein